MECPCEHYTFCRQKQITEYIFEDLFWTRPHIQMRLPGPLTNMMYCVPGNYYNI